MYPLHEKVLALAKEERRLTGLIIDELQKIHDQKIFLNMGYPTMFEYVTRALGYSEACAFRRIAAVRMAKLIPEVKEKLTSGALNLTNLTMAQNFFSKKELTVDRKREVLSAIENCSKRKAEEVLAKTFGENLSVPKEFVRQLPGDEASLHVRVTKIVIEKLDRVRNLRSHVKAHMTYGEVIDDMSDFVLKKIDPLRKVIKSTTTDVAQNMRENLTTRFITISADKRYVPANVKNFVWKRDGGRCTYVDGVTGKRCESTHLIQMDHKKPFALGGPTTKENMRLLCHAHHKMRELEFM